MTFRLRRLAVAAAAVLATLPARAALIDFDASSPDDYLFAAYQEDGFGLSVLSGHYDLFGPGIWCNLTSGVCPNNFLNVDDSVYGPSTVRIGLEGGGAFNLQSLDVLDVYQFNQQTYQYSACATGCLVRSSQGGSEQITAGTMAFSGTFWSNVEWIEISVRNLAGSPNIASAAIDNINVSAVPVPAAAWLFATGLAGLAARARRRRG